MGMWDVLSSGHQMTRKMPWKQMKSCGGYVQTEPCFSGSLWLSGSSAWCRMSIFRSLKKDHVPSYLSTVIRLRSKLQAATWHFFSAWKFPCSLMSFSVVSVDFHGFQLVELSNFPRFLAPGWPLRIPFPACHNTPEQFLCFVFFGGREERFALDQSKKPLD